MIHANRTAFTEQPNGDLVCTVTVPFAERTGALNGHAVQIELGALPGVTFNTRDYGAIGIDAAPQKRPRFALRTLDERLADGPDPRPIEPEPNADYTVELEAQSAADRPDTQTIGAGGFDTAQVVEAVAGGSYAWDHPAAPHMANIFRHPPFQRFAMERLHADKFAAPMECATRLITRAVKDKPMDAAIAALGATMNEYMAWAAASGAPVWLEH